MTVDVGWLLRPFPRGPALWHIVLQLCLLSWRPVEALGPASCCFLSVPPVHLRPLQPARPQGGLIRSRGVAWVLGMQAPKAPAHAPGVVVGEALPFLPGEELVVLFLPRVFRNRMEVPNLTVTALQGALHPPCVCPLPGCRPAPL